MVHTLTHRWIRRLPPSLVALLTLAAFLPALQNQFVRWDDDENFLDNLQYRGLGLHEHTFAHLPDGNNRLRSTPPQRRARWQRPWRGEALV